MIKNFLFLIIALSILSPKESRSTILDSLKLDIQSCFKYLNTETYQLKLNASLSDLSGKLVEPEKHFDIKAHSGEFLVETQQDVFLSNKRFVLNVNKEKKSILLNDPEPQSQHLMIAMLTDSSFFQFIKQYHSKYDSLGNILYHLEFEPGYSCEFWDLTIKADKKQFVESKMVFNNTKTSGNKIKKELTFKVRYAYFPLPEKKELLYTLSGNDYLIKKGKNYSLNASYSTYKFYNYLHLNK
jgi:hypothetical protein